MAQDIEDLDFIYIDGDKRPRPPVIPYLCPLRRELEPGRKYLFCTCGRSKDQPFCDGSEQPGDPEPIEFSVDRQQRNWLICGCKYSGNPVFCDGSHIHVQKSKEEILAERAAKQGSEEES